MAFFTSDWNPLGKNVFYRKTELYSMGWSDKINLSDSVVAAAPFGGPIALVRDEKKIQKVNQSGKPIIHLYSSSGYLLHSIKWNSGKLIHMAWSSTEDLLCVQDNGVVLVYDIFGTMQESFTMGQEVKDTKVLECKVFNSFQNVGIALLTASYRIFYVNNLRNPSPKRLAEIPGLDCPPSSWLVYTEDNDTRALVAKNATLYLVGRESSDKSCVEVKPEFAKRTNAIIEMSISPNNQNLALFSDSGAIWIGTSNFQKKYCEFDTSCPTRPHQLIWCGNQALLSYWDKLLLVIGMDKDFINYNFDSKICLVPEIDGARIITNTTHELLQKVPSVVTEIFRIASVAPGALLLEASKEFQKRSHKADDYMSMIRASNHLELAVDQCIRAAGFEWLPSVQKMLLRAASFGKNFAPSINPDNFVRKCQTLRVLNSVRMYQIGLPLTIVQLECLGEAVLLDRLVLRRHYYLAIRISKYLKIPESEGASRILAHWACNKVKRESEANEEKCAMDIANKLGDTPGISYSEIANKAVEYGKRKLAIKLLDYEPRASQQVPLLIKLNEGQQAMVKAIDSGDTDLVYMVIKYFQDQLQYKEFLQTINKFPAAYSLFLKLCKDYSLEKLRDMFYQEDNFTAQANCHIMESYQTALPEKRITTLHAASTAFRSGKNEFSYQQTEDQIKLLKYQLRLKEKLNQPNYGDLSVTQMLNQLIKDREFKLAEDFHKEFKIPDRRYWWVKIIALAEIQEWLELDRFFKSKRSPIGAEPFVDVCMKYNNQFEGRKYVTKVKEENKVKYYSKVGMLDEAAKIAFDQKDEAGLQLVLSRCGPINRVLVDKIASMKAQLSRH